MRKSIFLFFFPFILITAGFSESKKYHTLKKDAYIFIPGSKLELFDNSSTENGFYMSATEITNEQYRIFLADLKTSGNGEAFQIANVDSFAWNFTNDSQNAFMLYYHKHPSYDNYPVVNISYAGATLYCEWLTKKYNAEGLNIRVSLPTEIQWIYAACGGDTRNKYGWEGIALNNKKGSSNCNFKHGGEPGYRPASSKSYKPNNFGLYNMSGNVAEMLIEEGSYKGGCWWSEEEFLHVTAASEFEGLTTASPYIGFRPVITIDSF